MISIGLFPRRTSWEVFFLRGARSNWWYQSPEGLLLHVLFVSLFALCGLSPCVVYQLQDIPLDLSHPISGSLASQYLTSSVIGYGPIYLVKMWRSTALVTKNQKHKLWQNSKTQIMTKLKKTQIVTKLKNKLWQNSKTKIVTLVIVTLVTVVIVTYLVKTTWLLDNRWNVLGAAFRNSREVFFLVCFLSSWRIPKWSDSVSTGPEIATIELSPPVHFLCTVNLHQTT